MPICKKCNNKFPCKITLNGKEKFLHTRSYCLDCSPLGKNLGYDLRKESNDKKYIDLFQKEGVIKCRICERSYLRKKKNNLICSTCRNSYFRFNQRNKAIDSLGGKCSKCDCKDKEVLQFHHTDPNQKDFNLSGNWSQKEWLTLEKEIVKCILLCANCHSKEHRKDLTKIIEFYGQVAKLDETQQT